MSLQKVYYNYSLPEAASYEIDIPDNLDADEKEVFVIRDIEETYPDIENLVIEKIEAID